MKSQVGVDMSQGLWECLVGISPPMTHIPPTYHHGLITHSTPFSCIYDLPSIFQSHRKDKPFSRLYCNSLSLSLLVFGAKKKKKLSLLVSPTSLAMSMWLLVDLVGWFEYAVKWGEATEEVEKTDSAGCEE